MARVIIEQVFDTAISDDEYGKLSKRVDPCLEAHDAAWRRSYISNDRRRVTCEFEAADAEAVRQSFRLADVKFERAWVAEVFAAEDYPESLAKLNELLAKKPG